MEKQSIFQRFFDWFSDRYIMPIEFRPQLSNENLKNIGLILHFAIAFGISNACIYCIFHTTDDPLFSYSMLYYAIYTILSVITLIIRMFSQKFNEKKYIFRDFPFYFTMVWMFGLALYNYLLLDSYFNGTILFSAICIVSVIFFNVAPIPFTLISFITVIFMANIIYKEQGIHSLIDTHLLALLMFFLSMFKRRITKRDLMKSMLLRNYKEVLEEEVEKQTNELKIQHKKIVSMQNNTIIGLSNLVENRDSDTGKHTQRTRSYVRHLAKRALAQGYYSNLINADFISRLSKAAPMHDIGKIVVPDSILKKPGRLTSEEFEQIKRHTTEGGRIVTEVLGDNEDKDYIKMTIDVVSYHHEKWDGTGYPKGLKGNDIPLSARIMAIADVFDALVSPRCYKQPMSVDEAFDIIKQESGTHFDPQLATIFLGMKDEIIAVMERYQNEEIEK